MKVTTQHKHGLTSISSRDIGDDTTGLFAPPFSTGLLRFGQFDVVATCSVKNPSGVGPAVENPQAVCRIGRARGTKEDDAFAILGNLKRAGRAQGETPSCGVTAWERVDR